MSEWNEAIAAAAHEAEVWDSEPLSGRTIAQCIRGLLRPVTLREIPPDEGMTAKRNLLMDAIAANPPIPAAPKDAQPADFQRPRNDATGATDDAFDQVMEAWMWHWQKLRPGMPRKDALACVAQCIRDYALRPSEDA